ncbi:hypothetical protein EJB05_32326, partial [Eragrostis curvula]
MSFPILLRQLLPDPSSALPATAPPSQLWRSLPALQRHHCQTWSLQPLSLDAPSHRNTFSCARASGGAGQGPSNSKLQLTSVRSRPRFSSVPLLLHFIAAPPSRSGTLGVFGQNVVCPFRSRPIEPLDPSPANSLDAILYSYSRLLAFLQDRSLLLNLATRLFVSARLHMHLYSLAVATLGNLLLSASKPVVHPTLEMNIIRAHELTSATGSLDKDFKDGMDNNTLSWSMLSAAHQADHLYLPLNWNVQLLHQLITAIMHPDIANWRFYINNLDFQHA